MEKKEKQIEKKDNQSLDLAEYNTQELDDLYSVLIREKSEDPLVNEIETEIKRRVEGGKSEEKPKDKKEVTSEEKETKNKQKVEDKTEEKEIKEQPKVDEKIVKKPFPVKTEEK